MLKTVGSWVHSVATNPAVGVVIGTTYGFTQRLRAGLLASQILTQVGQRVLNDYSELRFVRVVAGCCLHLCAIPGVIGSLVAIASANRWISGGTVDVDLEPTQKAKRMMAVSAAIGLTVLPSVIEASGLAPAWMKFDSLTLAMTQGMAFYYGAKAAALYGHEKVSLLMDSGGLLLSALNISAFSSRVFEHQAAPDSISDLFTGFATVATTVIGAKLVSLLSKAGAGEDPEVDNDSDYDSEDEVFNPSFEKINRNISYANSHFNMLIQYEKKCVTNYDFVKLYELMFQNRIDAFDECYKCYESEDDLAGAILCNARLPKNAEGVTAKFILDQIVTFYHQLRFKSIQGYAGDASADRNFKDTTANEKRFFLTNEFGETPEYSIRFMWNGFIEKYQDVKDTVIQGCTDDDDEEIKGIREYKGYLKLDNLEKIGDEHYFTFKPSSTPIPDAPGSESDSD